MMTCWLLTLCQCRPLIFWSAKFWSTVWWFLKTGNCGLSVILAQLGRIWLLPVIELRLKAGCNVTIISSDWHIRYRQSVNIQLSLPPNTLSKLSNPVQMDISILCIFITHPSWAGWVYLSSRDHHHHSTPNIIHYTCWWCNTPFSTDHRLSRPTGGNERRRQEPSLSPAGSLTTSDINIQETAGSMMTSALSLVPAMSSEFSPSLGPVNCQVNSTSSQPGTYSLSGEQLKILNCQVNLSILLTWHLSTVNCPGPVLNVGQEVHQQNSLISNN